MTAPAFRTGARPLPFAGRVATLFDGLLSGLPGGPRFTGRAAQVLSLRRGDSDRARQLYRGIFEFAGQRVECRPAEVFKVDPPSAAWWDHIAGFAWLADFEASGLALYQSFARTLVMSFAEAPRATSFATDCQRLSALARHAGYLLAGASEEGSDTLLRLATGEARGLEAQRPRSPVDQLRQASALLAAGLAFRGGERLRDEALSRCASLADIVILPDGGPCDRNPQTLLELLVELIPLRAALEGRHQLVPHALHAAMERAIPMLRFLCHGDRGLVTFQGVEDTGADLVSAVLERDAVDGKPLSFAPHSGYARLTGGSSLLVADCGAPAQCDSTLAFEFSDGAQRLVISCGFPVHASRNWRDAARSTAAHSALEISVPQSASLGRRVKPARLEQPECITCAQGSLFKGRHVFATPNIVYSRDLFLSHDGQDLRGEDSFALPAGHQGDWPDAGFIARFHLAPGLRANPDRSGTAVTIITPDRDVWQFTVRGGEPRLEDSIFLATGGASQPCQQIVVRGRIGRPDHINWAFKKIAPPPEGSGEPRRLS